MLDHTAARRSMVERQIEGRGIQDARVLATFMEIPRHLFVPEPLRNEAYDDTPLPVGEGQTISQPYMVAVMSEILELKGNEKVLEIGTGSGYQTAILSRLCAEVHTIERLASLSHQAQKVIAELGITNVSFHITDGTKGLAELAPFDGILVTAGAPSIPKPLTDQLAEGGRLVIPVGDRFSQTLKRVTKTGHGLETESFTGCRFVDLIGQFGW